MSIATIIPTLPTANEVVLSALQALPSFPSPAAPAAQCRLLRRGEVLPAGFETGFAEIGTVDPEWCWVIDLSGDIVGCLLASPCHGTAVIWKVALKPGITAPAAIFLRLLRTFLRDCRLRGLIGYLTLVDPSVDTQGKLKRVIERASARAGVITANLTLLASPLPREGV